MEITHQHHLCDDTLLLVLSSLPPKSSARCKLVCSHWKRLISNSSYLKSLHKCCADHKRVVGFCHGSKTMEKLQFEPLVHEDSEQCVSFISDKFAVENRARTYGSTICATCDGYLLLEYPAALILRNPVTDYTLKIPLPPLALDSTRLNYFGLAVSSLSSSSPPTLFGDNQLCFDIMNITVGRKLVSSLCFIYSSSTPEWTPIEMDKLVFKQFSSPQDSVLPRMHSVWDPYPCLNPVGATHMRDRLHWLFDDGRIFAFDLEEQKWIYMETPAAGEQGELRLIKNYSDIISSVIKSEPWDVRPELEITLVNKLSCYLYPNTWFGSVGDHIYMLLVTDETNLQLWILDNYDEVDWKMVLDVKCGGFIAPVFFDGQRIYIAAFDFKEWKNNMGVIRFYDIFTKKWLPDKFIITEAMDQIRFFLPLFRP